MDQSLATSNGLPVIEAILCASPPIMAVYPAVGSAQQALDWKTLEDQVAAWAPAAGEPDVRTDEDGYLLPSAKTAAVALRIVARLREAGVAVPLRSGQTANGGINLEWRRGQSTERLTVNTRGEAELAMFESSKLVSWMPIALS